VISWTKKPESVFHYGKLGTGTGNESHEAAEMEKYCAKKQMASVN
jgi:hypothetical protein